MDALLRMDSVTKSFPGVLANDRISFEVAEGEVHALLGENGAGKTTLMRILYGMTSPDSGTIYWRGKPVRIPSSHVAIGLGIGMIHQHFMLIPEFTVAENVALGLRGDRSPLLDLRGTAQRLEALSAQFGLRVDPWARVKDLSTGEQQRAEIVKALYRGAHLLVLDEPTAVLTPGEADELFAVLDSLRAQGRAVVFISHKLREVMQISDRVTVLRRGRAVATVPTCETSQEQLANMMVGRPVVLQIERSPARPGKEVIRLDEVAIRSREHHRNEVEDISLTVREGEIVALTGVAGNGQRPLIEALFGLRRVSAGHISILGRDVTACRPCDLVALNVGRIPEDRQTMGLAMSLSVYENLALETYDREPTCRWGVLRRGELRRQAQLLREEYDIRMPSIDLPVGKLSGGNQQKVILARALRRRPRAIIAVDPTRGLDVGATEFVYRQLLAARDQGAAVLLISTDLEEVLCLSDRIGVIYNGQIMGVLPATEADETRLGLMMAGMPLANMPDVLPPTHTFSNCSPQP